jgi:hypothetical protein
MLFCNADKEHMKNIPLPPQRTSLSERNKAEIALKEKLEDQRRFA